MIFCKTLEDQNHKSHFVPKNDKFGNRQTQTDKLFQKKHIFSILGWFLGSGEVGNFIFQIRSFDVSHFHIFHFLLYDVNLSPQLAPWFHRK